MSNINDLCFDPDEDAPLVQMITLTINGTRYGLVGPVVFVPGHGPRHVDVDVSEIEFGEIMTVNTAARMLEGDFKKALGANVQ